MANQKQRIPLRTLSEHGWNGPQHYQSGNTAAAPSVGRPSGTGAAISTQINSYQVANDSLTISDTIVVNAAGAFQKSYDLQFPNIPVTQNNSTSPQPVIGTGNQTFNFTAPPGTLLEYYVWAVMVSPPFLVSNGSIVAAIATPWAISYAVDINNIVYNELTNLSTPGIQAGQTRFPSGVVFKAFKLKCGVTIFANAAITGLVGISFRVFGEMFLTYPSANPS